VRIFVTGASGFIGSALTSELLAAGHQVIGLARSDSSAEALVAAGAEVHRGSLDDLESLRAGAAMCDAIAHLAFNHDFSHFQENCETDRRVIEALGCAIEGSDRRLVVTAGIGVLAAGRAGTETDPPTPSSVFPRGATEEAVDAVAARGGRVMVVRLPQVHNPIKQGLITLLIEIAREKGVSAFVGDGTNRWPAVHVLDAAQLYRLVVETGDAGARYHAVGEEGVPLREIAEAIGRRIDVPVQSIPPEGAAEHFGWLANLVAADAPASSTLTQERLGWLPDQPGLISDMDRVGG
jgi:nucleoside-diphosphate-sugar epimerase